MKYKKIIISMLIVVTIIMINNVCYAKYVFEYIKTAAEIKINRTQTIFNTEDENIDNI